VKAFQIQVAPLSGSPIFRQIVDQVRLAVATGKLSAGDQLPSVRALAEELVVNPNTIAKAYAELSRDGIIEAQQGRGAFVAEPRQIYTRAERVRRIEPLLDSLINEALALGFDRDEILEAITRKLDKLNLKVSDHGKSHE